MREFLLTVGLVVTALIWGGWWLVSPGSQAFILPLEFSVNDSAPNPPNKHQVLDQSLYAQKVEELASSLSGDFSLVIFDHTADQTLVSHNGDQLYFSASLYKLYTAIFVHQELQKADSKYDPNQAWLGSYTLGDCLRLMITQSHSHCAERFLTNKNKRDWQEQLQALDVKGINTVNFLASANGMTQLLQRLVDGQILQQASLDQLKESMLNSSPKTTLKRLFPSPNQVYNKNGLFEDDGHLDVGLVYIPEASSGQNRLFIIALMSQENPVTILRPGFAKITSQLLSDLAQPKSEPLGGPG